MVACGEVSLVLYKYESDCARSKMKKNEPHAIMLMLKLCQASCQVLNISEINYHGKKEGNLSHVFLQTNASTKSWMNAFQALIPSKRLYLGSANSFNIAKHCKAGFDASLWHLMAEAAQSPHRLCSLIVSTKEKHKRQNRLVLIAWVGRDQQNSYPWVVFGLYESFARDPPSAPQVPSHPRIDPKYLQRRDLWHANISLARRILPSKVNDLLYILKFLSSAWSMFKVDKIRKAKQFFTSGQETASSWFAPAAPQ